MPDRLGATYIGEDGYRHTPVMLHRAILGSFERFIGILIENYAGEFPFWIAPEQVRILPVSDETRPFAENLNQKLVQADISSNIDSSGERLGKLIRNGEKDRVPILAVIGSKEASSQTVNVRNTRNGKQCEMPVDVFLNQCLTANKERTSFNAPDGAEN